MISTNRKQNGEIRLTGKVRRYTLEILADSPSGQIRSIEWLGRGPKSPTPTFVKEFIRVRNGLIRLLASLTDHDQFVETTLHGKTMMSHFISEDGAVHCE